MAQIYTGEAERLAKILTSRQYKAFAEQFNEITTWGINCKTNLWDESKIPEMDGFTDEWSNDYDYVLDLASLPGSVTHVSCTTLTVLLTLSDTTKYGLRCITKKQWQTHLPQDVIQLLVDMGKIIENPNTYKTLVC